LHVSEQNAEQTSGESGSLDAVSPVPKASVAPDAAAAEVESPKLAPEQPAAGDKIAVNATKEAPKVETPKPDAAKAEALRTPGKFMVMSSGDRAWTGRGEDPKVESEPGVLGKRRLSALAAVVVLAAVAGALGGALATTALGRLAGVDAATSGNHALEASVERIDSDVLALKASVEHVSKMGMSQFNKTSERLDKVEKAQAEPAAKLAKLSEAVDKLRAPPPQVAPVPVAAAAPAAPKEVTGSIAPPAATPSAAAAPAKPEVARLPMVEGWVLRDVGHGGALIEGRRGVWEVYPGDDVPGLGRVDAVRRQDGRWVVVTSKGLIAAR
jgi:hypothetical protein